ncbi:CopG family ribbon-helix-helix protein [Thermogladius sp. 4427co]|uniref:CopG family ribbon-helix-helix protein n=1 Tax=Thermogladius sp. 4427co TaxID=3450718 RepID=UPI003F7AA4AE
MKKRFGVSIPDFLACELDTLSKECGLDRSRLVSQAVLKYIEDLKHYRSKHDCLGACLIVSDKGLDIDSDIYKDIIVSYNHIHVSGLCVNVFILKGDSERILEFYTKLSKNSIKSMLVPLH